MATTTGSISMVKSTLTSVLTTGTTHRKTTPMNTQGHSTSSLITISHGSAASILGTSDYQTTGGAPTPMYTTNTITTITSLKNKTKVPRKK